MQFSHPSWVSLNTLVFWPLVPETLETNLAETWFLYKAQTMEKAVCHCPPVIAKTSFFSPQDISWHHSSLVVLIATCWAHVHLQKTEEEEVVHILCWHDCTPHLQMNPIWLRLSLFHLLPPVSFVLSFAISSSSSSKRILHTFNCGSRLLWKQLRFFVARWVV